MRKILSALMTIFCTLAAFGQKDSLLQKFKYRIDNFQAVGLGINGGSQYYETKPLAGTSTSTTSTGSFSGFYYALKSTDKILFTSSAGLFSYFNIFKSTDQNTTTRNKGFSASPYVSALNKWFSTQKFTELGVDISSNFYGNKSTQGYQTAPVQYNQDNYTVSINTGIGKGRLENVTDMQNALWLNKALSAANSLSRPLNNDELIELGQSITKGNNTRILDARRRIQFTLETVDAYLQKKGLINKTDIAYFSNLNDILFFAFNSPRLSGTEKFVRFTPSITGWNSNRYESNGTDKNEYRSVAKTLILSTGVARYMPTSLTHQNNYGASVKLFYSSTDLKNKFLTNGIITNENGGTGDFKSGGINLFYQHAIYPNTRTTIDFNLQGDIGYKDASKAKGFYGIGNLNCSLNYFISYRTRFTLNTGANYQNNNYVFEQGALTLRPLTFQLYANAGAQINL